MRLASLPIVLQSAARPASRARRARISAGSRGFAPFARPIGKQPSARSWGRAWSGLAFIDAVLYEEALSCWACMNNKLYYLFMTPMIP